MAVSQFSTAAAPVAADLSYCAGEARRYDNDRFLAALFAPTASREALFSLLAFNLEIAKTREVVTDSLIGFMRLQWWRDTIEALYGPGAPSVAVSSHAVVGPLVQAIGHYGLSRVHFDRLIDAREADLDDAGPASLGDLVAYAEATSAPPVVLGLEVLGLGSWQPAAKEAALEAGREVGIAWALTGILRALPFHLRQRRVLLPRDILACHGLTPGRLIDHPSEARTLGPVVAEIVGVAQTHLRQARRVAPMVPQAAVPALLPATLADLYLGALVRADHDVLARTVQTRHPWRPLWLAWRAWRRRY